MATTGFGLLVSSFTRTPDRRALRHRHRDDPPDGAVLRHDAAGLLPRRRGAALLGKIFPASYFMTISVGTFTKALGFAELTTSLLGLAAFFPVLTLLSALLLRKQER
jgi:ribosome-dependent ATPase